MKANWIFIAGMMLVASCSDSESKTPATPDSGEDNPIEEVVAEPFRANRLLIKHGLQLQCWVATDNYELGGAAGQPAYNMLPSDWALTGFTGPTFFGPPLINPSYFESFPESQWAIAKAPHGDQLDVEPTDYEQRNGYLSDEQKAHIDKLTTVCFGDEEAYSYELVGKLKAWYDLSRRLYPDVLVHNNQYIGQWTESNMRTYIREAKPDLITYDWYYFHTSDPATYIGARDMAEDLQIYRNLALEGWNGDKSDYLAFGQYILGFTNEGTYRPTESQLRLYYYLTWTLGGKWINWFRYLQGDGYGGKTAPTQWALLLENGMPGQPTHYMDWVNLCNTESKYIGDYLVRLKTTDVRYVAGSDKYTEGKPGNIGDFSPSASYIKTISAEIPDEPGQGTDLYLGFFGIIPEEEQGDPGFFREGEDKFFMITNGWASMTVQTAEDLSQKIRFAIDMEEAGAASCAWINPHTGQREVLNPVEQTDGLTYYEVELWGGSGALFMLNAES